MLGRKLNDEEREAVVVEVCDRVRARFDADPVMLEDSRRVFEFIEDENIPKVKERRPKFKKVPELNKGRCLVQSFGHYRGASGHSLGVPGARGVGQGRPMS